MNAVIRELDAHIARLSELREELVNAMVDTWEDEEQQGQPIQIDKPHKKKKKRTASEETRQKMRDAHQRRRDGHVNGSGSDAGEQGINA